MANTRTAAAAILAALSLSLAACGGGGDTLSKKDLDAKGTAICKDVEAKVKAIKQPSGANVDEIATYAAKVVPYTEELTSRLKKLKPADDVKADWNALTDNLSKASDAFKDISAKVKAKDQAGVQAASSAIDAASAKTDAAAKKLGLSGCN